MQKNKPIFQRLQYHKPVIILCERDDQIKYNIDPPDAVNTPLFQTKRYPF